MDEGKSILEIRDGGHLVSNYNSSTSGNVAPKPKQSEPNIIPKAKDKSPEIPPINTLEKICTNCKKTIILTGEELKSETFACPNCKTVNKIYG